MNSIIAINIFNESKHYFILHVLQFLCLGCRVFFYRKYMMYDASYKYDASKVATEFLKPLARNEFTVSDTLIFPELLKNIENSDDYEDVSYGVKF